MVCRIALANDNRESVVVSEDGSDVYPDSQWVDQVVMDAYLLAISVAQAVADDDGANQEEVDDALEDLNTATGVFNAAKADGTKPIPEGYLKVEEPETGKSYVIVGETDGKYYALTTETLGTGNDTYQRAVEVALHADVLISPVTSDMIWKFNPLYGPAGETEEGFRLVNQDVNYLYRRGSSSGAAIYLGAVDQYDDNDPNKNYVRYGNWLYGSDGSLRTGGSQSIYYLDVRASGVDYEFYVKNTKSTTISLYEIPGEVEPPVSKEALNEAIALANDNSESVVVSEDGSDVYPDSQWVDQAVMDAYLSAISVAQAVVDDDVVNQDEVDDALEDLNTATDVFNAAKADGKKIFIAVNGVSINESIIELEIGESKILIAEI